LYPETILQIRRNNLYRDFGAHIDWFAKNVESRKKMLPTFARLSGVMTHRVSEDMDKFIESHGFDIVYDEGGDVEEFGVPEEFSGRYTVLSQAFQNSLIFTDLLPKMTLVSLVSLFDALIARLVRAVFQAKPKILNGSEKKLSYSEIMEFNDLDEAREYVVSLEVESILRMSHSDQFDWLESRISIPLRKDLTAWKFFVEITERRNLLVHSDGLVSKQYLMACNQAGLDMSGDFELGDRVSVPPDYYEQACDYVAEIGIKLGQVLWRKLLPADLEAADSSLIDTIYSFLFLRRYEQALVFGEFATIPAIKHSKLEHTYYLKINYAIALRGLGKEEECVKLMGGVDWSALSDKFKIAAAVLTESWAEAAELMKRIGPKGDISQSQYRMWPLFRWFRRTDEFKAAYKNVFEEEFKIMGNVSPDDDREDSPEEVSPPEGVAFDPRVGEDLDTERDEAKREEAKVRD
jgi:hypothetical protein